MVWTDTFNLISIGFTPEIFLSSKNYKKAKIEGGLSWMTKYRELPRSLFKKVVSSRQLSVAMETKKKKKEEQDWRMKQLPNG